MAEFKQIIGRGTRLFPDARQALFDIIDYSGATALFADPGLRRTARAVDRRGDRRRGRGRRRRRRRGSASPIPSRRSPDDERRRGRPRAAWRSSTSMTPTCGSRPRRSTYLDPETGAAPARRVRATTSPTHVRTSLREPWRPARPLAQTGTGARQVEELFAARGIAFEELAERARAPRGRSVGSSSCSRLERAGSQRGGTGATASREEHAAFFEAHRRRRGTILDELLEKYAEHGIGQLDDLGILEVPPLLTLRHASRDRREVRRGSRAPGRWKRLESYSTRRDLYMEFVVWRYVHAWNYNFD